MKRGVADKAFYEKYAEGYQLTAAIRDAQLRAISDAIDVRGRLGLDVGCSTGFLARALLRQGARSMVGCDLSETAVRLALEHVERGDLSSRVTFLPSDATALPFPNETFDFVTCFEVLEHVPNPLQAVTELRRVVRPGGVVLISVPNILSPAEAAHTLKHLIMYVCKGEPITHIQTYTYWRIRGMLGSCLRLREIRGLHCGTAFLPYAEPNAPGGRLLSWAHRIDKALGRAFPVFAFDLLAVAERA